MQSSNNTPRETRPSLALPLEVLDVQLSAVDMYDDSSPEISADDLPFLSRPSVPLRTPMRTLAAKKIAHPRGVSSLGEAWNLYEESSVDIIEQFMRAIDTISIDTRKLDDAANALYMQLAEHTGRILPCQAQSYQQALSSSTMRRPITWARENIRACVSSSLQTIRAGIQDNYIRDHDSKEDVQKSSLCKTVLYDNGRYPRMTIMCDNETVPDRCSVCYASFDEIAFWSIFDCSCKFPSICWDCGVITALLAQQRSPSYKPHCSVCRGEFSIASIRKTRIRDVYQEVIAPLEKEIASLKRSLSSGAATAAAEAPSSEEGSIARERKRPRTHSPSS